MNRDAKAAFVVSLIESVKNEILAKVDKMPEDWDGRELREYLADKFEECRMPVDDKRRRNAYRNEVIVRNL